MMERMCIIVFFFLGEGRSWVKFGGRVRIVMFVVLILFLFCVVVWFVFFLKGEGVEEC